MELDIRDTSEARIDSIRFGKLDEEPIFPDAIWLDGEDYICIGNSRHMDFFLTIDPEEIDDLIKALQKAKELRWC